MTTTITKRKRIAQPTADEPPEPHPGTRLIDRHALLRKVPLTFPTIWSAMRRGEFPRGRRIGARTFWIEGEIDAWISTRPVRAYKGDPPEAA
jgi:predicted DNA-binding transcriptional regulator AlpA